MSETEDIRWQQRFENYEKSFLLLKKACSTENPSVTEEPEWFSFLRRI
tara:strand:+ start:104 stop:247 length:144 start_codon:yes stop_codon:yes gene_type:complete